MGTRFSLSKEGYIVNYLTTGAVTEPFVAPHTNKNQLKFEAEMRDILPQKVIDAPAPGTLGEKSQLGAEWKFYAQNRNTYIDFSKFYFTLTRVNLLAQTQLVSDSAKQVRARIWSYATIDLWLNGAHTANISNPVYKPISHTDVTLALREGVNDIFVCLQNFGVRDTRNMFALQLFDTEGISVTLPVEEDTLSALKAAEDWLCSVVWQGGSLRADGQPPVSVTVTGGRGRNRLGHGQLLLHAGRKARHPLLYRMRPAVCAQIRPCAKRPARLCQLSIRQGKIRYADAPRRGKQHAGPHGRL